MGQSLTPQQTLQVAQRVDQVRTEQENSNNPNNPEVAWWCKLLAKGAGVVGGGSMLILSIYSSV